MLDHLGEAEAANRIRASLDTVLTAGTVRTADLGGSSSTTDFTRALIDAL